MVDLSETPVFKATPVFRETLVFKATPVTTVPFPDPKVIPV